ncbi:hypothetical protein JX266_013628 [Neoarthrinium moseri]|nr:hypothetical protein JX266_013628 [Neoarthrinium moseri]
MPRKSDSSRRSDVSMAKFVLADSEGSQPEPATQTESSTRPLAPAAPARPASSMEVDPERGSESVPPSEKRERERDSVAIEDLNLPKSIITRLAKGVLPPNTQIQANAILAMTKAATVFINHLANAANERTLGSNKKTIMPAEVFEALDDIEYPEFRETVQKEFKKFNEIQSTKRNTYRRKVAAAKKGVPFVDSQDQPGDEHDTSSATANGSAAGGSGATFIEDPAAAAGIDTLRSIKKQRLNGGADDSAMTLGDADTTQEFQDAESEPDEHVEEDDEDDEPEDEAEEEDDDDEDGGADDDEMHDALEEREQSGADEDEALDNGEDSDS